VAIDTNAVCAFAINATTGVLKAIAGSPFTADISSPDWVAVDPTGRFLMVAEACCADTAGITVYTITPKTGKLTAVKGSPFLPPSGVSEPSSVTVDPTGRYVYVANGQAFGTGGATVYSINATSGKLTFTGTPIAGGSSPYGITTDVTGSYVYMTNNDSTIDAYAIANATGELSAVKGSPFSGTAPTRGIAADPSGKYLYVANSLQLLGYGINPGTGVLTVLSSSPYTAGNAPIDLTVGGTIK
jgi:6-phosphogluconolactonase (cycloisomerase 2 family)